MTRDDDYDEEAEAEAVLRHVRGTRLYNFELPMEVTIKFLKRIRCLLDEEIAYLTEESE